MASGKEAQIYVPATQGKAKHYHCLRWDYRRTPGIPFKQGRFVDLLKILLLIMIPSEKCSFSFYTINAFSSFVFIPVVSSHDPRKPHNYTHK